MTIAQQFISKDINYLEYDFNARKLRRNSKYLNKEIATKNLLDFRKIFYQNGIKFFLVYGTLLGAIRDKDFISHDTDTDIGIFEEDRVKLINIIPLLLENGFQLIRTKYPDDLVTFMRNDEYIDIGIFRKETRKDRICYKYQNNFIEYKFLSKLDIIKFLNEEFYIPYKATDLLYLWYGKDWITPYPNEPAMEEFSYKEIIKRKILRSKIFQLVKPYIKKIIQR